MKKSTKISSGTVWIVFLLTMISFIYPVVVHAKSVAVVEGATFNVANSINDNLTIYTGKNVVVHLRSGKSFEGYVKSVGNHLVHLEKIAGRDFYDALIRIEDITALEVKFRDMK